MEITNNIIKKGLDGFAIKIIALGLMTMDHMHQFFSLNGIPIWFNCLGRLSFVILGIMFFYLRNNRKRMMIVYLMFSLAFFPFLNFSFKTAFYYDYQWMMIFSMPLMLLYNEKKGHGLKYLFYIYYPAHIFLFFFISGFIKWN